MHHLSFSRLFIARGSDSALGNVRFRIDVTIKTSRDRREIFHFLDCNTSLMFLHFNRRQFRFERRVDERLLSTRRALILLHSCRVLNIYWVINAGIAVLEAAGYIRKITGRDLIDTICLKTCLAVFDV